VIKRSATIMGSAAASVSVVDAAMRGGMFDLDFGLVAELVGREGVDAPLVKTMFLTIAALTATPAGTPVSDAKAGLPPRTPKARAPRESPPTGSSTEPTSTDYEPAAAHAADFKTPATRRRAEAGRSSITAVKLHCWSRVDVALTRVRGTSEDKSVQRLLETDVKAAHTSARNTSRGSGMSALRCYADAAAAAESTADEICAQHARSVAKDTAVAARRAAARAAMAGAAAAAAATEAAAKETAAAARRTAEAAAARDSEEDAARAATASAATRAAADEAARAAAAVATEAAAEETAAAARRAAEAAVARDSEEAAARAAIASAATRAAADVAARPAFAAATEAVADETAAVAVLARAVRAYLLERRVRISAARCTTFTAPYPIEELQTRHAEAGEAASLLPLVHNKGEPKQTTDLALPISNDLTVFLSADPPSVLEDLQCQQPMRMAAARAATASAATRAAADEAARSAAAAVTEAAVEETTAARRAADTSELRRAEVTAARTATADAATRSAAGAAAKAAAARRSAEGAAAALVLAGESGKKTDLAQQKPIDCKVNYSADPPSVPEDPLSSTDPLPALGRVKEAALEATRAVKGAAARRAAEKAAAETTRAVKAAAARRAAEDSAAETTRAVKAAAARRAAEDAAAETPCAEEDALGADREANDDAAAWQAAYDQAHRRAVKENRVHPLEMRAMRALALEAARLAAAETRFGLVEGPERSTEPLSASARLS
jgi:hypothetical protein